jgi:hypothetical protein
MRRALRIHSHSQAGCTRLTLSAGGKKSTYVQEGSLHLRTTEYLPCFVSFRGKKSRRILSEQASYSVRRPQHTQSSSNPSTTAAGSSNGLTNTRCCRYSCLRSWWWVVVPPETCRAVSR